MEQAQWYQWRPGEVDAVLVAWWHEVRRSGEAEAFWVDPPSLAEMFQRLPREVVLLALEPNGELQATAWFSPFYSGAFFGFWLAPKVRGTRAGLELWRGAAEAGFEHFSQLFAVTCQPALLRLHRRLGYRELGKFEGLWRGKAAWLMVLEKQSALV